MEIQNQWEKNQWEKNSISIDFPLIFFPRSPALGFSHEGGWRYAACPAQDFAGEGQVIATWRQKFWDVTKKGGSSHRISWLIVVN